MKDEEIDKLFEAEFGADPTQGCGEDLRWECKRVGFRAAMNSAYVQSAIRAAKAEGMRIAAKAPMTVTAGMDGYTARAIRDQLQDSIRQRADELERQLPNE